MKKSVPWSGLLLLAIFAGVTVLPAMATLNDGKTYQCWSFDEPTGQYGIMPDQDSSFDNEFGVTGGGPIAMIQNLSPTINVAWTNNYSDGAWLGEEFKIILDIPNQPIDNPYKDITIKIRYQGVISFVGATGIPVDGPMGVFDLTGSIDETDGEWKVATRYFRMYPNPMEEIIVVGFNGTDGIPSTAGPLAILDQICVETICVPEPMTFSLLALGAGVLARRKQNKYSAQF